MLEKLMKLYVMYMATDVRSPMPHLFGPPGCGKSTAVEDLARLLGVNLHIVNVSRISPLELEGFTMPHGTGDEMVARLLHAPLWTSLKHGDIILMDEFLRGFPEVYNGLLDIFTSRQVAGYKLPQVFIIGASNSTVAYDKALEDRLLHLPVSDPRSGKKAKKELAEVIVGALGLHPDMITSMDMQTMLDTEVLPMYEILDNLKGKTSAGNTIKGSSPRNLIGQAKLREVTSTTLRELINFNNMHAMRAGKPQYVLLPDGKASTLASIGGYINEASKLNQVKHKLTDVQRQNLELNLQLIEMESIRNQKESEEHDDSVFLDDLS